MARPKKTVPAFCKHTATGQGYVTIGGHRHYLGRFDDPATKRVYEKLIAEWLAGGRRIAVNPDELTIVELAARFWQHASDYYPRATGGRPGREALHFKHALKTVIDLYGDTLAKDFGPRAFKAVRERLVTEGKS